MSLKPGTYFIRHDGKYIGRCEFEENSRPYSLLPKAIVKRTFDPTDNPDVDHVKWTFAESRDPSNTYILKIMDVVTGPISNKMYRFPEKRSPVDNWTIEAVPSSEHGENKFTIMTEGEKRRWISDPRIAQILCLPTSEGQSVSPNEVFEVVSVM
ncbi:hypothetical protein L218DRAFT_1065808 [Marasmius fiardii PR-910]|nr:hypothetical protein L218DRAFT_1065808 [Marasmius fiardii PR-910]